MERTSRRGLVLAGGVMAFAIGWALHCGDSGTSTFDDGCAGVTATGCGASCTDDAICSAGLSCINGKCGAECGPTKSCVSGLTCSAKGRCVAGGGFVTADTGPGPSNDAGPTPSGDACADLALTLGASRPTIMLLIDRSGSMDGAFGTGTRWTTLKDVLLDGGVISSLQSQVVFGMQMYSNPSRTPTGCPNLEGVGYALDNFNAIRSSLGPAGTHPDTPTGESVLQVAGIIGDGGYVDGGLAALDAGGGEKIILLVTDGDPDYCGNPFANDGNDAGEIQKAKDISIRAVQRAFAAGIKTYVLAIGNEVSEVHQQEVANVGLGFNPDAGDAAPFFRPANATDLRSQLDSIIFGARPCKFTLNASVESGQEAQGRVTLNGTELRFNDANGWRLSRPNELELQGAACQTVKTTPTATLSATFPCGAVVGGPSGVK